ncbi:M24 family metallopeptidase [Methylorubrum aminovorans]
MPSLRPLQSGDLISIEAEARWAGYVAQNTHPVFLGRAPDIYKELFHRQQEAIERCYEALRPGATAVR